VARQIRPCLLKLKGKPIWLEVQGELVLIPSMQTKNVRAKIPAL